MTMFRMNNTSMKKIINSPKHSSHSKVIRQLYDLNSSDEAGNLLFFYELF